MEAGKIVYHSDSDVLIASVWPKPETRSRLAAQDFWLLVDGTGRVVGFECLWFSEHVKDEAWLDGVRRACAGLLVGMDGVGYMNVADALRTIAVLEFG
jgi:uncharacterized protein YuzE